MKDYDVQQEEVKLLNGIKMHVDSGWVVDKQTLEQLFIFSGISDVKKEYDDAVKDDLVQADSKQVHILQFAYKAM